MRHPMLLGPILWIAGMVGVATLIHATLPELLAKSSLSGPIALTAALVQSGAVIAFAVGVGSVMGPRMGLRAPAIEAMLERKPSAPTWRTRLTPAIFVGSSCALFILSARHMAPAPLLEGVSSGRLPLEVKILYGGVTEEILMRWGLMTLLAWTGWRILQRGQGSPRRIWLILAATLSAVVFGMAHIPAVIGTGVEATAQVMGYVTVVNFVPGLLLGLLFWRHGLEAACLAHMFAHIGVECGFALLREPHSDLRPLGSFAHLDVVDRIFHSAARCICPI